MWKGKASRVAKAILKKQSKVKGLKIINSNSYYTQASREHILIRTIEIP